MDINSFIEKFKGQLEDTNIAISTETNYVKEDFWDSLTSMVIKVMIEDEYGLDISLEQLNQFESIQQLFDFVKANAI